MAPAEPSSPEKKPVWRRPAVQELGNLRDFVRSGNAFGKSVQITDGSSMAGNESQLMDMM